MRRTKPMNIKDRKPESRLEPLHLEIGRVYYYKDKYIVYITGGAFLRNGRVSNFWDFRYVMEDGTLGAIDHDYDQGDFEIIPNLKPVTTIDLSNLK